MAKSKSKKKKNSAKRKSKSQVAASSPAAEQTAPELALNLADIGHQVNLAAEDPDAFRARLAALASDAATRFDRDTIDRIYVGSYFCDRFFLSLNDAFYAGVLALCRDWGLKATLVVPVFGQSSLAAGRRRAERLLEYGDSQGFLFDEAVANDPAMALALRDLGNARRATAARDASEGTAPSPIGLRLIYGRMMAKSSRDPRHQIIEAQPQPYALDAARARTLVAQFGYELAECDPTAPQVDANAFADALPLALHLPHCFMTTGHICQAASMDVPRERKFRADMPCRQECLRSIQVYEHRNYDTGEPRWFTRQGRTILFENPRCEMLGTQPRRIVWTPADFICSRSDQASDATAAMGNNVDQQAQYPYVAGAMPYGFSYDTWMANAGMYPFGIPAMTPSWPTNTEGGASWE